MHTGGIPASFRCAIAGLRHAIVTQRNLRIQLGIGIGIALIGLWLRLTPSQWAVVLLTAGFVLVCEIGNTALEALVDVSSPDYSPLAKAAKDAAAGAVLVASLTAAVVGLLVLGPALWGKLGGG